MIKAIFFDVGNTLIHTAQPTSEVCQQLLQAHGYSFPLTDVKAAMRLADAEQITRYHTPNDDWSHPHTIAAFWLDYYQRVFDELGLSTEDQQLAHELMGWYAEPAAWQPFPEARDVLAHCHARGFQVGAVSDWAPSLLSILRAHGFTRYLDFVLCSGSIGFAKPSLQFYRLALRRSGVQPHEAIHVGDNYYADVRGARAAGITPVLIDRAGKTPTLDCTVIRNLWDLEVILDRAASPGS